MLKRSMLLQKAKNSIPNILVLNKYISNTHLTWKTISVLFPTKGFTQRPFEAFQEVARELNFPSGVEKGMLPTPGSMWRRENNRSSSLLSARR